MPINPAALPKCFDCPIPAGYDCLHQSISTATATPGSLASYYTDEHVQDAQCALRRAGRTDVLARIMNVLAYQSHMAVTPLATEYYVEGDYEAHNP